MKELFYKWGMPINASTHGARIDDLVVWIHWIILALFVGWSLFFLFVVFRFRKSRNPTADYKGAQSHASSYLEGAIAVVEILLLVFISMPIWAMRVRDFPDEDKSLQIRVVAEQFAWNFHYPGNDRVFGKTSPGLIVDGENPLGIDFADEHAADDVVSAKLWLPVDTDVIVKLSSKDVIHCFSLPTMRVKQDVIPGSIIPQWFRATLTHEAEVACAQLCGLGHYRMRATMQVVSQEDFEAWYGEQIEAALEAAQESDDEW